MPVPRLRRTTRPRSRDDDDWGTSSPAAIMKPLSSTHAASTTPIASASAAAASTSITAAVASTAPHATGAPAQKSASAPSVRHVPPEKPPGRAAVAFANLKQQDLKSYTNTFSPRCVIPLYFGVAVLFLTLGILVTASSANLRSSRSRRYDDMGSLNTTLTLTIRPTKTIRSPSYLYYGLTNYFQNHRDYVKSRSDLMNQGQLPKAKLDVENCERYLCPGGNMACLRFSNNESLQINNYIYPCGLTAWSFFNDSFQLCNGAATGADDCDDLPLRSDNIAWNTDKDHKFRPNFDNQNFIDKNPDLQDRSANELLQDPHFLVWMRLSAFPTFYKLYAVIERDLEAGLEHTLVIDNRYPVSNFTGEKWVYITETAWFGDSNAFLGTSYLIVGVLSLIVAIFLLTKHVSGPVKPADIDPAIVLREHLAKYENEPTPTVQPLHLS